MEEMAAAPAELVTEEEARATAQEVLTDWGRLGGPTSPTMARTCSRTTPSPVASGRAVSRRRS